MSANQYDALLLDKQLCFPLYACSREVIKRYRPYLEKLGLTYTQYIVLLVLWEADTISVRDLGKRLYLDSGTLTPVLKTMEKCGYITRRRSMEDERLLMISLTQAGMELREKALSIPEALSGCLTLDASEAQTLYRLLYKVLASSGEE